MQIGKLYAKLYINKKKTQQEKCKMMVANAFRPPQYQLSSSRSCVPSEFGPVVTAVTRARNWLHCCVSQGDQRLAGLSVGQDEPQAGGFPTTKLPAIREIPYELSSS